MQYRCVFPNCDYETDDRSLIEFHHINPREISPRLNSKVTIPLCPTHHKLIYHPLATSGQHSERHENSLMVEQVATTSVGKSVIFKDMAGREITVSIDVRSPKPDAIFELKWDLLHGISDTEITECDGAVEARVDYAGYCAVGHSVFYSPGHRKIAADLLRERIAAYMTKTKTEYENALASARSDWKALGKF